MEFHQGRLMDHVHLRVADLEKSRKFYRAILGALGREFTFEDEQRFASDELYVNKADDYVTRIHLAFQVPDHEAIKRFHQAGIANGGTDNGVPGERPYHPGYYAAFVLDPDGNNIEAVHHGPHERSAKSITLTTPG